MAPGCLGTAAGLPLRSRKQPIGAMERALKRLIAVAVLALPLAGCNSEFSLSCATPKGTYLLMVKPGIPWLPLLKPSLKWITTANVYDLQPSRSDDYQVIGELTTRIAGWPAAAERQVFVVNRITSEFQTAFFRKPNAAESADATRVPGEDIEIEAIKGSCARSFPQRL
jgi:hypothetical protein